MKPNGCSSYSNNPDASYNNNGDSAGSNRIRVIRLRRRNNLPLGFSIRGGREHGTGVFVSEVRAGSEAHHQGLLVGDQILRINGFNIEHAIHDEVLALLRAKPGVVIKVKSMGMIPVKDTKKDPLTWKIVDPGPTDSEPNGKVDQCVETRISIPVIGSSGLGCSIVKGPPDVPGIYVQSVKPGGLAEKAGLQVGDRIIEMNGHDFSDVDFPEAVAALKSSKQMSLVLLKCAGSHLFSEEKLRRSAAKQEEKKLSCVEEEETRDESRRDAKTMNGHSDRVKSATEHKHQRDGLVMLNGNAPSSDASSQQVTNNVATQNKHSHKVHATVHSSSGDDEHVNSKCSRGAGDGMDYEIMNGHKIASRNNCSWNTELHEPKADSSANGKVYCSSSHTNSLSEDDSCSSFSSSKETYMSSDVNSASLHSLTNGSGDKTSVTSDEKSELSSISSDDYPNVPKIASRKENAKPQNEFLKRKQHELLMEEFREVHKKMFGQGLPKVMKPPKKSNAEMQVSYRRRQREPPITDSRKPDPKPPQTYFEKNESIVKPLVTIGTYSNSQQQNRFLNGVSCRTKDLNSSETNQMTYIDHHKHLTSSSASSIVPSSSSSEPRSPTSESIVSSDSAFTPGSPLTYRCKYPENIMLVADEIKKVPNVLKTPSSFQKDKIILDKTDQEMKPQIKRQEDKSQSAVKPNHNSKRQTLESLDELLLKEAEGRQIQRVILKKNGPLTFTIEGGINSDLGGKIKVSEILPGNCMIEGGSIDAGDQILMVDNTRLTGLSLTAANVALRNANSNSNMDMMLLIIKAQKPDTAD